MPKKSRRSKATHRAKLAKATQERHPQQLEPTTDKLQSPARISHQVQDFTSRYQYIMPEVKRIGILAGSMILILIILSFVHWW
jgi:hypothetical protein